MAKMRLISTELSKCCGKEAQIVLSRRGGLISRGCLMCGKSGYVNEGQIPKIPCESCRILMEIKKWQNYFYECPHCKNHNMIADIVPLWSEEFRYSGLAAYGDPCLQQ